MREEEISVGGAEGVEGSGVQLDRARAAGPGIKSGAAWVPKKDLMVRALMSLSKEVCTEERVRRER